MPEAATNLGPLASKELFELVLSGRFYANIQETNDLTKGISPFTCGLLRGSRDPASMAATTRINSFDLMQSGAAAPSLAEQAFLSSNDVTFPTTIHGAGRQLNNTSIVLDVVLGHDHHLATAYRDFCKGTWRNIEAYLYAIEPGSSLPVLPLIMRWMQLELGAYFRALADDIPVPFPKFNRLGADITRNAFHLLPPLPAQYFTDTNGAARMLPPTTKGPPPTPPATSPPSRHPSSTPTTTPTTQRNSSPNGNRIINPFPNPTWITALTNWGRKINELRQHIPTTTDPDTNEQVPLCLSYHLRGTCFEKCARLATHRPLSANDRRRLQLLVNTHLRVPATPTTSTPNTAGAPNTPTSG
jgi:hypothetical protein